MDSTEQELEAFRQKWRAEVTARTKGTQPASPRTTQASSSRAPKNKGPDVPSHVRHHSEDVDEAAPHAYHDLSEKQHGRRLDETSALAPSLGAEPKSALDHYEKAVEKETQGSLGDSLNLYRKAFKLDDSVHEKYKAKHFPPKPPHPKPKPQDPNSSNAPVTVPDTAHHSLQGLRPTLQSMIEAFSALSILGDEPPTDFSPPPPCPIAATPEEILVEILEHVALQDVASFARLSQVCRRLAYLVTTEERVWKRIALGHEYGFAAMHYTWSCQVDGKPLGDDDQGGYILGPHFSDPIVPTPFPQNMTPLLVPSAYPTYRTLFRRRPRVRFNGCYISTVNYTRPGASSPTSITWNSPIHIVTYYRYLRFLRDGTCISLLTTSEPSDVVPYLYVENMHNNHHNLPSAPMKDALLGRWRLTGPEVPGVEDGEKEGTLEIETAGATPKYMYKMYLDVGIAGRAARNNKLGWQGYWSYNRLTDDWGEFGLKNDRPFYWSRVKSYGMSWEESGMKC
ncbi:uncharacterized protein N0V89_009644 [Didymosphaeria variabile]|uniref:F-box domain-containing protein n=1 Tax=Didymosphaeria variabile TaxID=1932322 RepID=A0A9W8XE76_9PLEO|nr:uncharacterized protein N0V89_009644 [Didymosphaeria variabile]KAJ4348272.1 hypothetical protein N0V89_009644 [Didymosphaeria variabile]